MLELFLGLFVYDTIVTINDNIEKQSKKEDKQKRLRELQVKMKNPVTQGHRVKCICRLCVNRRSRLTDEHNQLLAKG